MGPACQIHSSCRLEAAYSGDSDERVKVSLLIQLASNVAQWHEKGKKK
jgi:hypothetical protein